LLPHDNTIQPNLLDMVITTLPRMRACKFSSARSGARPANNGPSMCSNAACAGSIGTTNERMPRPSASVCASATLPSLE
jgi:hypothetical protein